MSPRTKTQFEQIRKVSRNKILSVSLELFAKQGYKGTSIAQIASKANISKGLMYNYFKNKENLLEEIVLEGFNIISELNFNTEKNEKPNQKLKRLINAAVDNLFENLNYWLLYTALLVQPQVQKKFEKKFYEFRNLFISSMAETFRELGSDDPEIDSFLLGMHFDGLALNFVSAPDDFPMEKIKPALFDIYSKIGRKKNK